MAENDVMEAEAEEAVAEGEHEHRKNDADVKAEAETAGKGKVDPAPEPEPEAEPETPDWRSLLTDKEAKKVAERFNSPDEAMKAVADLRKQISDRIRLPGKDATDEDVAKFRKALGVPEKPDGYKVELPEGAEENEAITALVDALKPEAHAANVSEGAFNVMATKLNEFAEQVVQAQEQEQAQQREKAEGELQKEWGKNYKANVNVANRAIDQLAGEEIAEFLSKSELKDGSVLANHPQMVRLFAKLGRQMSEDGVMQAMDQNEAKGMDEKIGELTQKANAAYAKGDKDSAQKLFAERDKLADTLYGDAPIVGAQGRAV